MSAVPSAGRIIDHVVILVPDLAAARDAMATLGFAVLPRGGHPIFGTANHTIMLDDGYIELLGVAETLPVNQYQRDYIAAGGGLLGLAFATTDADATAARLARQGIAAAAPMDFDRPVETPSGTRLAQFRTLQLSGALGFQGYGFFCAHRTPELVWLTKRPTHANGAMTIAGVTMKAASGPAEATLPDIAEPGATGPMPDIRERPALSIRVRRRPDRDHTRATGFSWHEAPEGTVLRHPALGDVDLVLVAP